MVIMPFCGQRLQARAIPTSVIKPSHLPYLWMIAGALAFAAMGTLAHALQPYCDWHLVAMARTGLALVFAAGLAVAGGAKLVFLRPATLWIRSIAGSVSLVCTFFALPRLPLADVFTLTNVFPIWVALLSWPLLGERPTREVWLSVAAGVLGVALVQQPHLDGQNFASWLALASSFSTAVAMLGLHQLQGVDVRAIVVHFSAIGLLACFAVLGACGSTTTTSSLCSPPVVAMLLGVGVTATIGQVFLTKAFAAGPPAKVSVVGLVQVVFAIGFDRLFWGRTFGWSTLAGMVLVLAPTARLLWRRGENETSPAVLGDA